MTDGDNEDDLYDEFGNYIGPDLDSDADSDDGGSEGARSVPDDASDVSSASDTAGAAASGMLVERDVAAGADGAVGALGTADALQAIVLHEDKQHYPSAAQVYGEDVTAAVLDEDAADIRHSILPSAAPAPDRHRAAPDLLRHQPQTADGGGGAGAPSDWLYAPEYLGVHLGNETTRTRRGVALVGHLHHGKTSLVDLLLEGSLRRGWDVDRASGAAAHGGAFPRYTDTLRAEQERQMSLQSTPITWLGSDTRGKTYAVTAVDCPGHVNFHDESVAALRLMDGAVLVVDAVEGVMLHTELLVRQVVAEGLPLVLVVSKLDRLIVELKLPPRDAYFKLLSLIESVNALVQQVSGGRYPRLSPERGNVAFSSAQHGYVFTLQSFAQVYLEQLTASNINNKHGGFGANLSVPEFAQRLWGDAYLDPATRCFQRQARDCRTPSVERTFVTFVLEPLYKIYAACLGELEPDVDATLRSLGVYLSKDQLRASARPLLRVALGRFLQNANRGFVDMVVQMVPSPAAAAAAKVARCYSGPLDAPVAQSMIRCDPRGPLVIHCTKLYFDGQSFQAFGRIYSGTVRPVTKVNVLGEGYTPENNEDSAVATVEAVAIPGGRADTKVSLLKAGNWVMLQGVDASIAKTATIVGAELVGGEEDDGSGANQEVHIFAPLKFPHCGNESVCKLAIEPLHPAELPKMVDGLRRISKAYPMSKTKVEESGEHILLGTGELYLDCMMHDLRNVFSDIEVKVADPIVSFRETAIETSSIKCFAETANKRNKLTFICEPLDDGLAEQLESGKVNINWEKKKLGRFFQTQYNWDLLASRSVWAFGDSATHGTNLLMDDTLPGEVDKQLLLSCRSSIVQGFQWATREGPLCEEPVRGTKIKLLDAALADKPLYRGGGQIIPTTRRTVHSSILTATPRLLEPIYRLQIQCPGSIVDKIQPLLQRRRGHIVQDRPISGSTFYSVKGFLPVLDSFGFETDLRTYTQGQAMVHSVFDHWAAVPGDPLDRTILLHPLEPSPPPHLARELLLKTRRRKGLAEDVTLGKFFDDALMQAQLHQPEGAEELLQ